MSPVFLDTVGLLAIWDENDQWHASANTAFQEIVAQRRPFLTTSFVLLECGNAAARRPYRDEAIRIRELLEARNEVAWPTQEDWAHAWREYSQSNAAGAGLVDCVSFVVMRRLGLRQAFTNDKHFEAAGFEVLF